MQARQGKGGNGAALDKRKEKTNASIHFATGPGTVHRHAGLRNGAKYYKDENLN